MKSETFKFHGGLHLQGHKDASTTRRLQRASLPGQLFIPLKQHIGDHNKALVEVGERVLKNQLIGDSSSLISAPIHASSSGRVSAIDKFPVAHPSGQLDTCIVIDVDGEDESIPPTSSLIETLSADAIVDRIRHAGIVGLGGAVFPTTPKLVRARQQGVHTLIINGVECEPYLTCDDMLMRTCSAELMRGIAYLQRCLQPRTTLIAIEDNKPEATTALKDNLANGSLENARIVTIPTLYPSGGEKQLIQVLTGREVPRGHLAFDIGLYCQNVATCAAIAHAVEHQQPLISRVVTISGNNILQPGNWEVRLGTPIAHLVELAGGYRQPSRNRLVMGGPMMGFTLSSDRAPIVKASNNILVMEDELFPPESGLHDECIRCGKCSEVCPVQLLPQQLYWHARAESYERAREYSLFDCIECGCCSVVCPSHIPLVQYYRAAKSEIRAAEKALYKSDRARVRFEFREKRLLAKQQEQAQRRRLKREALQNKNPQNHPAETSVDPVQAALDRVKARKKTQQSNPANITNLTAEQQSQIDKADARRKSIGIGPS